MRDDTAERCWWRTRDGLVGIAVMLLVVALMIAVVVFGPFFTDAPRCKAPLMNGGCPFGAGPPGSRRGGDVGVLTGSWRG